MASSDKFCMLCNQRDVTILELIAGRNPHGDKYSEQSYGTTAHATEDVEKDKAGELKTDPEVEKKEKSQGVFRQIL